MQQADSLNSWKVPNTIKMFLQVPYKTSAKLAIQNLNGLYQNERPAALTPIQPHPTKTYLNSPSPTPNYL